MIFKLIQHIIAKGQELCGTNRFFPGITVLRGDTVHLGNRKFRCTSTNRLWEAEDVIVSDSYVEF